MNILANKGSRLPSAAIGTLTCSLFAGCAADRTNRVADAPSVEAPLVVSLNPVPGYAARYIGSWAPWTTPYSDQIPQSLKRVPSHSESAVFGEFSFGEGTRYKVEAEMVGFMLDEVRKTFIVDENRNGDLTDDRAASWSIEHRPLREGAGTWGQVTVRSDIATSRRYDAPSLSVAFFFTEAATRETFKEDLGLDRYRDYATEGILRVGSEVYRILLDDGVVSGDFSATPEATRSDITVRIDVNRNGLYEERGESFDASEPFTIKGVTYKVASISADGRRMELVRSDENVPEIAPPPNLAVGQTFPAFTTQTLSGAQIDFPSSFAGKIVLLDFWASWCGPCIRELPHLIAAHERFHQEGLEIVSISIDEERTRGEAQKLITERNLQWHQVFDSGGWKGTLISMVSPGGIPAGYLVDGSTGRILASLDQLRGEQLVAKIQQVLAAEEFSSRPR